MRPASSARNRLQPAATIGIELPHIVTGDTDTEHIQPTMRKIE